MRAEVLLNTIRHIPDIVRRIPSPRQRPDKWFFWGVVSACYLSGSVLIIHQSNETRKQNQAQAAIDAQKREYQRQYNLAHNPPPTVLTDGRIETHVSDKGEITTARFVDRYSSLDSKPQEDVPWRFSTDPKVVNAHWAKKGNTIYLAAVSLDASEEARGYLMLGLECHPNGELAGNDTGGIFTYAIPVQSLDCIKPKLSV